MLDVIAFILKAVAMILLAIISQWSLQKKMYGLAITALGTWLVVFRLLATRAVIIYSEMHNFPNTKSVSFVADFAQSSQVAIVTDGVLVIGLLILSFTFARYFIKQRVA